MFKNRASFRNEKVESDDRYLGLLISDEIKEKKAAFSLGVVATIGRCHVCNDTWELSLADCVTFEQHGSRWTPVSMSKYPAKVAMCNI